jgi:hypothetical protein
MGQAFAVIAGAVAVAIEVGGGAVFLAHSILVVVLKPVRALAAVRTRVSLIAGADHDTGRVIAIAVVGAGGFGASVINNAHTAPVVVVAAGAGLAFETGIAGITSAIGYARAVIALSVVATRPRKKVAARQADAIAIVVLIAHVTDIAVRSGIALVARTNNLSGEVVTVAVEVAGRWKTELIEDAFSFYIQMVSRSAAIAGLPRPSRGTDTLDDAGCIRALSLETAVDLGDGAGFQADPVVVVVLVVAGASIAECAGVSLVADALCGS